ncbi:hypothetical protein [Paenibacillus sp. DYY-L-2]|uniref:hypothetical protein n=1 Tax=Paenibacillus sp. DYY-L-2 TaxID=3447013 RepID=UPI003F504004
MKNKRTLIMFIALLTIIIISVVCFFISEHRNKQAAEKLGKAYVIETYAENNDLKLTASCHPFFSKGDYQIILENSRGEAYFLMIMLTRDRALMSVDDLTSDVRQGDSVFPCRP